MTKWISIKEGLPESRARVIFTWQNSQIKRRTSIGFYAAHKSIDADIYEEIDDAWYDEETDRYWLPEGWYEEAAEGEYFYSISNVTHWQPLPEPPK